MAEQIYDPDTEELKELVKKQAVQIDDMQRTLHKMHNAQRRHLVYRIVWWLLVTGIGAWAYYTYVWPQLEQIMEMYGSAQDIQVRIQDYFAQFGRTGE